jgi:hypothetical protein
MTLMSDSADIPDTWGVIMELNAYVLGTHEGELPTHVLGAAGSGSVRAMGRLEGSPHTVFVALEGDTPAAIEEAIAAVSAAGVAAKVSLTLNPDGPQVATLIPGIIHWPSRFPPYKFVIFIYVEADGIDAAFNGAVADLGSDHVSVAGEGDGRFLVELVGDNAEAVEAAAAAFATHHPGSVVGRVAGGLSHAGNG